MLDRDAASRDQRRSRMARRFAVLVRDRGALTRYWKGCADIRPLRLRQSPLHFLSVDCLLFATSRGGRVQEHAATTARARSTRRALRGTDRLPAPRRLHRAAVVITSATAQWSHGGSRARAPATAIRPHLAWSKRSRRRDRLPSSANEPDFECEALSRVPRSTLVSIDFPPRLGKSKLARFLRA